MRSIFSQWKLAPLRQDCLLCEAAESDVLCDACAADMPTAALGCPQCAAPGHADVCGACIRDVPHFNMTVAAFLYRFPLDKLVQAFKFNANLTLIHFFSRAMYACIHERMSAQENTQKLKMPMQIIALPLAKQRLATRGFNQAALLADALALMLDCPVAHHSMLRIRETPPQSGLSRAERLRNVKGAFDCTGDVAGKHIAIVDDVMTTGATLSEAARVLKLAGAAEVSAYVLARAMIEPKMQTEQRYHTP